MDAEAAARMAKANPSTIIGFKSAHYAGPGWSSVDGAVKAGALTKASWDGGFRVDHAGA